MATAPIPLVNAPPPVRRFMLHAPAPSDWGPSAVHIVFYFAPGYQEFTPEGEVNANPRLLYWYLTFLLLTVRETCIDICGVDGGRLLGHRLGHGISLWSVIYVHICTVRSPPKTKN